MSPLWRGRLMVPWHGSRFTGLFTQFGLVPRQAYDPALWMCAGTLPPWGARSRALAVGGAGWERAAAESACLGEAIERLQPYPLPCDQVVEASFASWPLDEAAVAPDRWVLFHAEQYAHAPFPFQPFPPDPLCPCSRSP